MALPGGLVNMKIRPGLRGNLIEFQVCWRKVILCLYLLLLGMCMSSSQETLFLESCRGGGGLREESGVKDMLHALMSNIQQLRQETQQLRGEVQLIKEQLAVNRSRDPDPPGTGGPGGDRTQVRTQTRNELRSQLRSLRRDVLTEVRRDLDLVKRTVSGVLAGVSDKHTQLVTNITDHWIQTLDPLTDMCQQPSPPFPAQLPVETTAGLKVISNFRDCTDVWFAGSRVNGSYYIKPADSLKAFAVYCEFDVNGAWTVFQRRQDGSVDFYRGWDDYKVGFGDIIGEHWLGNAHIHELTNQGTYRLAIDLWDWRGGRGNWYHTEADSFSVEDERRKFRLTIPSDPSGYSGYFGAGLRIHAGPFCTRDRNNLYGRENCAETFHCGWWFTSCVTNANLNGRWFQDGFSDPTTKRRARDDIYWPHINQSLKKVVMKLKRESFNTDTVAD